jgi:hypothetical protein
MIDNRFAVDVQGFVRVHTDADLSNVGVNQPSVVPLLQVLQNERQRRVREENQVPNSHLSKALY